MIIVCSVSCYVDRSTYPVAERQIELLQLWTSVSNALCGCVNNPQNGAHNARTHAQKLFMELWGKTKSMQ